MNEWSIGSERSSDTAEARGALRQRRGMPPPVFCAKSGEVIENKGRAVEKSGKSEKESARICEQRSYVERRLEASS